MRVGRFVSVLVGAGVVVMSCGLVLSEGDAADEDPPPAVVAEPASSIDDALASDDSPDAPADPPTSSGEVTTTPDGSPTSAPETTVENEATSEPQDPSSSVEATTSTEVTTSSTSLPATTTTAAPTRIAAATGVTTIVLLGLCSSSPTAFVFSVSNLGAATVTVTLVFRGTTLQTMTLPPGQLAGFVTPSAGTVTAVVGGATVATATSAAGPCGRPGTSVGFGGICRDPIAGYQWLIGTSGPAVDVEVRLEGVVVDTFKLARGGFAGFNTPTGGMAEALVAGKVVVTAFSSESPCFPTPVQLVGVCFAIDTQHYRWSIWNSSSAVVTAEFVLDGASLGNVRVAPEAGTDFETKAGGTADLVLGGRVVSRLVSEKRACDTSIFVFGTCSDAASGSIWQLGNYSDRPAVVRLVFNGVDVASVSLPPHAVDLDLRELHTDEAGTMEVFAGDVILASSESSPDPCAQVNAVCTDSIDGHVWQLSVLRDVRVELRIGGTSLGSFDSQRLSSGGQVASRLPGKAAAYIDGTLVSEATASNDPCVALNAECANVAEGYLFGVYNRRDVSSHAEVRMGGTTVGEVDLVPYGFAEVATDNPGTAQLYLHGALVWDAIASSAPCNDPAYVYAACFDPASGYYWSVANQRGYDLAVDFRLDGQPMGSAVMPAGAGIEVVSQRAGTLQVLYRGMVVSEGPSSTDPCLDGVPSDAIVLAAEESATTVGGSGGTLPATGGGRNGAVPLALVLLAAGASALLVTRRRSVHG